MPLLATKLYILNKIKKKDEEAKYVVSLTNEICENDEEVVRKKFLYEQKIWACRITGQVNLTFKEALKSEQGCTKMLKNSFKKCYEKPTLQFVHYSRENLDVLIHKAWTHIHQEFCVNEPVVLKIVSPDDSDLHVDAIIVKVNRIKNEESDVEQTSPVKIPSETSSTENREKKKVPEKKQHTYVVKIPNMDKLVRDIPADSIERSARPPSKDQIRMFIRSHALRHSGKQTNPWVVEDDMVRKYKLTSNGIDHIDLGPMGPVLREVSRTTEMQVYNKLTEENTMKNSQQSLTDDSCGISLKSSSSRKSSEKRPGEVKKLKQTTLFTVKTSNNRPSSGSNKSPFSSPTRNLPIFAQKLLKTMKETPLQEQYIKNLIFRCAQNYTEQQIARFPEMIRSLVKVRKEKIEEKKRIEAMSPEEKEAYLQERKNQLRRENREKKREENAKIDDEKMEHKQTIPVATKVETLPGITNSQWGRILCVCEFIRCYRKLLNPGLDIYCKDLTVEELCRGIVGETDADKFVLSSTLCMLLKPLLQEKRIREKKEIGVSLSDYPVTPCTAAELLRLILPLTAENISNGINDDDCEDEYEDIDVTVSAATAVRNGEETKDKGANRKGELLCEKLRTVELDEFTVEERLDALELLKDRIMELEAVSVFIEEGQRETAEAYKRRLQDSKEVNERLKEVRTERTELLQKLESMEKSIENVIPAIPSPSEEDTADGAYISKRKHSLKLRMRENEAKERKYEVERQLQKLEKEEVALKKSLDTAQKSYNRAVQEAKQLLRVHPLGTDRHWNRYWYFSCASVGVYVENEIEVGTGESCWRVYRTIEEVMSLRDVLCDKAVRESVLLTELDNVMPKIRLDMSARDEAAMAENTVKSYFLRDINKQNEQADFGRTEDGFLVRGFKTELRETELNIRQGGLGGVEDLNQWEDSLKEGDGLLPLKQALAATLFGITERFLGADLKSAVGRTEFLSEIEKAQTVARLCLLQACLDASACWSRAAAAQKCRVCKRGHAEEKTLLCDGCDRAYHMFCLRPPLKRIPDGEWLCQSCKMEQVDNNKVDENQDGGTCCVCGDPAVSLENHLAQCNVCRKRFHAECHEPPLRHVKRLHTWACNQCRRGQTQNGSINGTSTQSSEKKFQQHNQQYGLVLNDEASSSSASDNPKLRSRQGAKNKKKTKNNGVVNTRPRRTNSTRRNYAEIPMDVDDDDDDDEEEVEDEEHSEESDQEPEKITTSLSRTRSQKRGASEVVESELQDSESDKNYKKKPRLLKNNVDEKNMMSADKIERIIQKLLRQIYNHKASDEFIDPVDAEEVTDYYDIIRSPICISQMLDRQREGYYSGGELGLRRFVSDIELLFNNAETYNSPESVIAKRAILLEKYFESSYSKSGLSVPYKRKTKTDTTQNEEEEEDEDMNQAEKIQGL